MAHLRDSICELSRYLDKKSFHPIGSPSFSNFSLSPLLPTTRTVSREQKEILSLQCLGHAVFAYDKQGQRSPSRYRMTSHGNHLGVETTLEPEAILRPWRPMLRPDSCKHTFSSQDVNIYSRVAFSHNRQGLRLPLADSRILHLLP